MKQKQIIFNNNTIMFSETSPTIGNSIVLVTRKQYYYQYCKLLFKTILLSRNKYYLYQM